MVTLLEWRLEELPDAGSFGTLAALPLDVTMTSCGPSANLTMPLCWSFASKARSQTMSDVTRIISRVQQGGQKVAAELLPLV
jgi:hypothetical protein